jgi:hypothetical protein
MLAQARKTGAEAVLLDDSLAVVFGLRFIAQLKRTWLEVVTNIVKAETHTLEA